MNWFAVSKEGLAKLLEKRGKAFAIFELLQNSWDEPGTKRVEVTLKPVPGHRQIEIEVTDDAPEGFQDLTDSFTLFAESRKKAHFDKRGRFNLGEKLVLAICDEARIETTTGTMMFDKHGRRRSPVKTERGSRFFGLLRMTREEYDAAMKAVRTLIPPAGITTTVNGEALVERKPVHTFEATLPTEIADAEGNLRRTARKTAIEVHEPLPGEMPSLYEMGIPIVETGDRFHVNVGQKVPLNMDRDNVPPSYLRQLRTLVVNEMHDRLTEQDANQTWVREATSDEDCEPEAVRKVMDLRFGRKRVAYDPSDPEANNRAVAEGYVVVHGGMMNKTEWTNAKKADAIRPAGQVTPSPKPFSLTGDPLEVIGEDDLTEGMRLIRSCAKKLAKELVGADHTVVEFAREPKWPYGATYGPGHLVFNVGRLGRKWFEQKPLSEGVLRLLLHELAHHTVSNHLSEEFADTVAALGARLAVLLHEKPGLFEEFA